MLMCVLASLLPPGLLSCSIPDLWTVMIPHKSAQVRSKKPPLPPDKIEGTQVTVVGATLSNRMLQKIQELIPVRKQLTIILLCCLPLHVSFLSLVPRFFLESGNI